MKSIKLAFNSPTMQSGKTTASTYLVRFHRFEKLTLARSLKNMATTLLRDFHISDDRIAHYMNLGKEEIIPEIGSSYRYICQTLGTEWGRNLINVNIWVRSLTYQMSDPFSNYVCEDLRLPNEYHYFKNNGFKLIRIVRPGIKLVRNHSSEGALDEYEFDYIILNNGTIHDLYDKLDNLIKSL